MPAFSISEYNKNEFLNCRTQEMYQIVNKHIEFLTTQIIGTCKRAYSRGMSKFDNKQDKFHYVINDLDNTLYSIDYNAPMLFAEVYEALSPTIKENIQLK